LPAADRLGNYRQSILCKNDNMENLKTWLEWAYQGNAYQRKRALDIWRANPDFFAGNPWMGCAVGDEAAIRAAFARDAEWINLAGGPFGMPPLVAVTHSNLIREEGFEAPLLASARWLLAKRADVNGSWTDPRWPDAPLSALYGAAGRTHNPAMTELLLAAGANPNDNESLYHSVESRDGTCTRLLLRAGARVVSTNAIGRVLDYDKPDLLRLLLETGGDAKEEPWLHHAILRGRSLEHIRMLMNAGADPHATNKEGISLFRWAQLYGRTDVVNILGDAGIEEPLTVEERFVAACARGDKVTARTIREKEPDIFSRLNHRQMHIMPELAGIGNLLAVRVMLALGWPLEIKAGWGATALNLAVYSGDAEMAALLLGYGADWRTPHAYGDNVLGTLSYASQQEDIEDPAPRDYVGCARAIIAHGVQSSDVQNYTFSPEVTAYFESLPAA
jgi:hypothetical protein